MRDVSKDLKTMATILEVVNKFNEYVKDNNICVGDMLEVTTTYIKYTEYTTTSEITRTFTV